MHAAGRIISTPSSYIDDLPLHIERPDVMQLMLNSGWWHLISARLPAAQCLI